MHKFSSSWHIDTSGWSYAHWKGPFYPEGIRAGEMLDHYCRHFMSVELNNAFYHLPSTAAFEHWRESTPAGFVFSVKASRYITHMKKLNDTQQSLQALYERVSVLGNKLGPVLFQLPPRWHYNHERLSSFLNTLSKDYHHAFEFRDQSWLNESCYELLASHGAACCIYELDGYLSPKAVTGNIVYIRLHGPDGPYQGDYDKQTLAGWAGAISSWKAQGKAVYCYFDNDESGYAVKNAKMLQEMLSKRDR